MRPTESERIAVVNSINSCIEFDVNEVAHMLMSWTIPAAISKRLKRTQGNPPALLRRQDRLLAMRWKAKRIQLEGEERFEFTERKYSFTSCPLVQGITLIRSGNKGMWM
jgi:hypothetical protein